ncbi:MAG: CHAT domain-containing protein [Xanthomonadales bacterium]|nr:CHAT domain-containing protein [Xanthomonadales bacterium]
MRSTGIPRLLFSLAGLLAGLFGYGLAVAQNSATPLSQEYFVQQAADEALLIRVDAFEAEFESTIRGEESEVLLRSGIPDSRIAPVFQYVQPPAEARQLGIEVVSSKQTSRSEFELQITRLTVWDERSNAVSQAYQMLSYGMQAAAVDSAANWTVRINSLNNAAKVFGQYGMNEMRLWSRYLAAHLVHHQLHDYSMAYRMAREVIAQLDVVRLPVIELASWQLQGAALIGLKRMGTLPATTRNPEPVQSALRHTAQLAESMGALQTQAQALFTSGREYIADERYMEALEQFQRAVEIADAVGDKELSRHSREALVEAHKRRGDTPASSEVLQQIEQQLSGQGAGDELALNLLAQARLLISNYRYARALDVLNQAMGYQNNSAIRKQLEFELARVFHETGRLEESLTMLQRAGISAQLQKRANSILDNGQALALLAAVQRGRGAYEDMREARRAQGLYDGQQSRYLYQRGLDELAAGEPGSPTYFKQSLDAATRDGDPALAGLALLQYCLADIAQPCSRDAVETAYQRLVTGGVPRHSVEAMYLRARLMARQGQYAQAIETLRAAVDEIHFLRHSLPGVLGAWYYERHESLFGFYLDLLTGPGSQPEIETLLALGRMRLTDTYDPASPGPDPNVADVRTLRSKMAEWETVKANNGKLSAADAINESLAALRGPFRAQFAYLSEAAATSYLRSLASDEVLLTYHLGADQAHVWAGHKGRVVRREIEGAAAIYRQLLQAHGLISNMGEAVFIETMDELGKRLLAPVADLIDDRVYWIPAGPLLGLPLDAMRMRGHYLAEKHDVVNLLSFPPKTEPRGAFQTGAIDGVFVAGYPQDFSADYAVQFETTDEIRTVMDIFVGPGLNVVQGPALLPDEFQDQRFTQASLAHLAMPGVIDLHDPLRSSLVLSGTEDGPARTRYRLENILPNSLGASLVFLSSTRTTGTPRTAFSSRPGLVADLTRAGARAVIADMWDSAGNSDRVFLADFYRQLRVSGDIAGSLSDAKRHYIRNNRGTGLYAWAGYQLFIP